VACFVFFFTFVRHPEQMLWPLHPHISIYQIRLPDDIAREAEDHRPQMMSYIAAGWAWQNLNLCCCVIQHVVSSGCIWTNKTLNCLLQVSCNTETHRLL